MLRCVRQRLREGIGVVNPFSEVDQVESILNLQSASKLLRHSYLLGAISSSVRTCPPPPPLTPHMGTMLCYFLLPKTLNNSGTTLIRGEGEGIPAKVRSRLFFFENNKSVVTSVLC